MGETEKSTVNTMEQNKLADRLQDEAKFTSWDFVHYNREAAMDIVQVFMDAGWEPKDG